MDDKTPRQYLNTAALESVEQARLVAVNPSTDPELLRKLAQASDRATREAVAANPNTPSDVLLKLGAEFPAQFLDNPIFSLLLLENINFVEEIPLPTLCSILRLENVPLYILEKAADKADLDVQLALANNIQTPKQVLSRLAKSQHFQVKEATLLHVNFAGELTDEIYEEKAKEAVQKTIASPSSADTRSLAVLAQLCPIPAPIVEHWLQKSNRELCRAIAQSRALSSILEQLANHPDAGIRIAVAENPNTPIDTLQWLAAHNLQRLPKDREQILYLASVRASVASNPSTPVDILEKLASDENNRVRLSVVKNPNTSVNILQYLVDDRDREVAETATKLMKQRLGEYDAAVLRDPKTPTWVVEKLAKQEASAVAAHPNAPLNLLLEFSKHKNWGLREAVAKNPNAPVSILEQLAQDEVSQVRRQVAVNPNIPVNLLEQLAKDPEVRQAVAKNPNTPIAILEQLAKDQDYKVRIIIASKTNLSSQILEELANDKGQDVRQKAMENPNLSKEAVERIVCGEYAIDYLKVHPDLPASNPDTVALILNHHAKSKYPLVSYIALCQPQIYKELLEEKSYSISWLERFAVAQNLHSSAELLQRLTEDSNQLVRAATRNSLQKLS